jgi:hypothetical protein
VVQPTDGRQTLVVPNYNPEQAMHFFARHAYSASSFSQTFRFFENRKNYVFATNEFLQREVYTGIYTYKQNFIQNQTPEGQADLQFSIIGIDYGEVVNSITDINGGGYNRTTFEMDAMYNVINRIDYNHERNFYNNNPDQKLYHTLPFIRERLNKIDERWALKDYSSEGMPEGPAVRFNTHYADIYNKKGAHLYHLDQNKTSVTIYGNNAIVAGSTIDIQLLKHTSEDDQKPDIDRSGEYIIESIENVFYENTYIQKLTITRNGIGNAAL